MTVASLVDSNVLVYRCDRWNPAKQERACEVLRRGGEEGNLFVPHQALVEFVAATTRRRGGQAPILELTEALTVIDEFMLAFVILFPSEAVVRSASTGAALHRLPWYDAHLWAYADAYGIDEILTEDTPSKPRLGTVRYTNPFLGL